MKNIQKRVDDLEATSSRHPQMFLMRRIVSPANVNAPVEVAEVGGTTLYRHAGEAEDQFINRVRSEAKRGAAPAASLVRAAIYPA